jgi:hypoxanthine-guanine phosphoribosyltransferase
MMAKKAHVPWLEPAEFENTDVLVVEDIIDEGSTIRKVPNELRNLT